MFDIGWAELLVIAIVILFAFGPDDIPKLMYGLGRIMRRFRYMRYALSSQFDDFMDKAEASGKVKPAPVPAAQQRDSHPNDETEADEYLMDMLPPPEGDVPEKPVEDPDEPRPDTPADRG